MRHRKQYLLVMTVLAVSGVMLVLFLTKELEARREAEMAYAMPHQNGLPILGSVTDFALATAADAPFGLRDLHGKISVVDFIFTSCGGICPVMTNHLSDVHRVFDQEPRVQFVSITVDPETDTPEVLRAYSERYRADSQRWHFLRGDPNDIHALAVEGFKVGSMEDPLIHSPHFVLVDGEARIRGYYTGTDPEERERIAQDIRKLLAESPELAQTP